MDGGFILSITLVYFGLLGTPAPTITMIRLFFSYVGEVQEHPIFLGRRKPLPYIDTKTSTHQSGCLKNCKFCFLSLCELSRRLGNVPVAHF